MNPPRNDLAVAIVAVIHSKAYIEKYPGGASAYQILDLLRHEDGSPKFPHCSGLDVYDELQHLYGAPK